MKKLIIILAIMAMAVCANAWTLRWDAVEGAGSLVLKWKPYPDGYAFPGSPAPTALIEDMELATEVTLPGTATEWELPETLSEGSRYVFFIQALNQGSVSGNSDYLCWTKPQSAQVVELPLDAGGDIQINIYQTPR